MGETILVLGGVAVGQEPAGPTPGVRTRAGDVPCDGDRRPRRPRDGRPGRAAPGRPAVGLDDPRGAPRRWPRCLPTLTDREGSVLIDCVTLWVEQPDARARRRTRARRRGDPRRGRPRLGRGPRRPGAGGLGLQRGRLGRGRPRTRWPGGSTTFRGWPTSGWPPPATRSISAWPGSRSGSNDTAASIRSRTFVRRPERIRCQSEFLNDVMPLTRSRRFSDR